MQFHLFSSIIEGSTPQWSCAHKGTLTIFSFQVQSEINIYQLQQVILEILATICIKLDPMHTIEDRRGLLSFVSSFTNFTIFTRPVTSFLSEVVLDSPLPTLFIFWPKWNSDRGEHYPFLPTSKKCKTQKMCFCYFCSSLIGQSIRPLNLPLSQGQDLHSYNGQCPQENALEHRETFFFKNMHWCGHGCDCMNKGMEAGVPPMS